MEGYKAAQVVPSIPEELEQRIADPTHVANCVPQVVFIQNGAAHTNELLR